MNEAMIALDLLELALKAGGGIFEMIAEKDRKTLEERIALAREAIKEPVDTNESDAARRAKLERILRGEDEGGE